PPLPGETAKTLKQIVGELTFGKNKRIIFIIARQHSGEVVGSWVMQGFLRFLLSKSPYARVLREKFVFHIIPMVNIDGVVYGNARCTLAGVDPNRVWNDPNPIIHPVIHQIKEYMRWLPPDSIDIFLDFHGHSAKCASFFYGCQEHTDAKAALFPKLASLTSRDISFEDCRWQHGKSHTKSARAVVG
ncbi:unnamed protein product, partial [Amoebophrya sp. A25]